jgi:hypothetical protein
MSQADAAAASASPQLGGDLIYEYTVQLTGVTEYGVSLADLLAGEASIPPEGARFDFPFEGVSAGPRLKGTVKGVDYANLRADGRVELHLHAEITDEAGKKVALFADGVLGLDLPPGPHQPRPRERQAHVVRARVRLVQPDADLGDRDIRRGQERGAPHRLCGLSRSGDRRAARRLDSRASRGAASLSS